GRAPAVGRRLPPRRGAPPPALELEFLAGRLLPQRRPRPPCPRRLVQHAGADAGQRLLGLRVVDLPRLERLFLGCQVLRGRPDFLGAVGEVLLLRGSLVALEVRVDQLLLGLGDLLLAAFLLALAGAEGGVPRLGPVVAALCDRVEQGAGLVVLARLAQGDGMVIADLKHPALAGLVLLQRRLVLLAALRQRRDGVGRAVL